MFKWLLVIVLVTLPSWAWAVDTSTTSTSTTAGLPSATVGMMTQAFQDKNWTLLAGLLLSAAVFALKTTKILDKIKLGGKWGIRISTVVISTLTSISLGLVTSQSWWLILTTAFGVAAAAIGGWEIIGKMIRDLIAKIKGK